MSMRVAVNMYSKGIDRKKPYFGRPTRRHCEMAEDLTRICIALSQTNTDKHRDSGFMFQYVV